MKKMLLSAKLLHVFLAGLLVAPALGQSAGLPGPNDIKTHILQSGFNKKEYCIHVLLPKNYSKVDTIRYPVLYVLDGRYSTLLFYSMIEVFALGKEVKDLIVVTIDGHSQSESDWLTSRYSDYTPSCNPKADTAIAGFFKIPVSKSGGAPVFLATLEKEIIPLIEQNYKTNDEKSLYGHSLGGLFAGYCFITKPSLFQKYSMNSPSFWWNNGEMTTKIDSLARKNSEVSANIYVSAGLLEGGFMITPVNKFTDSLNKNFHNIKVNSKIFDEETHLSIVALSCTRTLRLFYAQIKK
jgi:predicted alpha/beta superfamily hydrolase